MNTGTAITDYDVQYRFEVGSGSFTGCAARGDGPEGDAPRG